jgi:hypothetical protein
MRALKFLIAGGVAAAALMSAAPAAAQYYPGYPGYGGYGYGNPYGGNVIGQVLGQVLGGGYGGYGGYGYGANSQIAVSQCTNAVQARLGGYSGYGYSPYGYGGGYNNYGYANGRVLGVSRVEPRSNGGLTVRGVASSGRYAGYGAGSPDLTWKCKVDYRGRVTDIDVDPAQGAYGYSGYGNSPYNGGYNGYDYSQYGYRRY